MTYSTQLLHQQTTRKPFNLHIVSDVPEYTTLLDVSPFISITDTLVRQIFMVTKCDKLPQLVNRMFIVGALNRKPCVYLLRHLDGDKGAYYDWELGKDYSFIAIPPLQLPERAKAIWQ